MSTKPTPKKISRRDAIKLLGAVTGATVLANLPSKWKTPEIVKGVLPAHAQTSNLGLTIQSCEFNVDMSTGEWSSTPYLVPFPLPQSIPMTFTLTFVNTHITGTFGAEPQPPYTITTLADPTTGTITGSVPTNDNQDLDLMVPDSGATSGSVTILWEFYDPSHGIGTCSQTFNWALPTVVTQSIVDPSDIGVPSEATFTGEVTDEGSAAVTERGFQWSVNSNMIPVLGSVISAGTGLGVFSSANVGIPAGTYYGRAYATNAVGTAYGNIIQFDAEQCLAQGTLITLANGTSKKIEDINYSDSLLVWNFDEGTFDEAKPLWIKKTETANKYNLIEFSDGSFIKTIHDHRIFNKEKGMFTYPMISEDAPVGTTTFNVKGEEVTLVSKSIVTEQVNFYNVITNHHINLFANGILTSCRYNNIYPIADMKFVKDERLLTSKEAYGDLPNEYYESLRLAEQEIPIGDTVHYVNRLEMFKAGPQDLVSEEATNPEQFEVEPVI